MPDALTLWLMTPDAPDEDLILEDFLTRPDWHSRAACRRQAPSRWVSSNQRARYEAERAVCASCPVREECLTFALEHPDVAGCWGGTDDRERRELHRQVA